MSMLFPTSCGRLHALSKALQVLGQEVDTDHHVPLGHVEPPTRHVHGVDVHLKETTEPRELLNGG